MKNKDKYDMRDICNNMVARWNGKDELVVKIKGKIVYRHKLNRPEEGFPKFMEWLESESEDEKNYE